MDVPQDRTAKTRYVVNMRLCVTLPVPTGSTLEHIGSSVRSTTRTTCATWRSRWQALLGGSLPARCLRQGCPSYRLSHHDPSCKLALQAQLGKYFAAKADARITQRRLKGAAARASRWMPKKQARSFLSSWSSVGPRCSSACQTHKETEARDPSNTVLLDYCSCCQTVTHAQLHPLVFCLTSADRRK